MMRLQEPSVLSVVGNPGKASGPCSPSGSTLKSRSRSSRGTTSKFDTFSGKVVSKDQMLV
jgi:hypothetical protein